MERVLSSKQRRQIFPLAGSRWGLSTKLHHIRLFPSTFPFRDIAPTRTLTDGYLRHAEQVHNVSKKNRGFLNRPRDRGTTSKLHVGHPLKHLSSGQLDNPFACCRQKIFQKFLAADNATKSVVPEGPQPLAGHFSELRIPLRLRAEANCPRCTSQSCSEYCRNRPCRHSEEFGRF